MAVLCQGSDARFPSALQAAQGVTILKHAALLQFARSFASSPLGIFHFIKCSWAYAAHALSSSARLWEQKKPIYYQLVPARNAYMDESWTHETEPMKHSHISTLQVFGGRNQEKMSMAASRESEMVFSMWSNMHIHERPPNHWEHVASCKGVNVASDWLTGWVTRISGGSAVSVEHEAELERWAIFILQPPSSMHTHYISLPFVHFSHYCR